MSNTPNDIATTFYTTAIAPIFSTASTDSTIIVHKLPMIVDLCLHQL